MVLVEYAERHPVMQSRPGMGLRLATFYRRSDTGDAGHKALLSSGQLCSACFQHLDSAFSATPKKSAKEDSIQRYA